MCRTTVTWGHVGCTWAGISNPAVNYGEINPGRKLQQLNFQVPEVAEDIATFPKKPASVSVTLPVTAGLPNGVKVTNKVGLIPGEGIFAGRVVRTHTNPSANEFLNGPSSLAVLCFWSFCTQQYW